MYLSGIAIYLAVAVRLVLAQTQQYIILQSQLTPGQTGKSSFDNLYFIAGTLTGNIGVPIFAKGNYNAYVLSLIQSTPASGNKPALNYLSFNETSKGPAYFAQMQFTEFLYGDWEPVAFNTPKKTAQAPTEDRFYTKTVGGTTELLWSNDKADYDNPFNSWLLCDWVYGYPQLFFTVYDIKASSLPASCALISIKVIPVPNGDS